jgi:hypothetical protein
MRPLLPEAGGTIAAVERSEPIRDRAKARGLGASTSEAGADAGQASDVGGSESPTSPAACESGPLAEPDHFIDVRARKAFGGRPA